MGKIIMHVDMDAFYAAIEQREQSALKGKPVIIGGTGDRGVVATCSYEARAYGVHSAMAMYVARQKCPEAVYLPVRMKYYKKVSNDIFKILNNVSPLVEQVSIDEAYIDITHCGKNYYEVAQKLKRDVKYKIGLDISVGISYNKFLAKLASEWEKPNGFKIISKKMVPKILMPLPIRKIQGIGEKSVKKLNRFGIYKVEDLYSCSEESLIILLGKNGSGIYKCIRGQDDREIEVEKIVKSYGRELTLPADINEGSVLEAYLEDFSVHISYYLRVNHLYARTITIKLKDEKFCTVTRSKTLNNPINMSKDFYRESQKLFLEAWKNQKIRLIGLTASGFTDRQQQQLNFFEETE